MSKSSIQEKIRVLKEFLPTLKSYKERQKKEFLDNSKPKDN